MKENELKKDEVVEEIADLIEVANSVEVSPQDIVVDNKSDDENVKIAEEQLAQEEPSSKEDVVEEKDIPILDDIVQEHAEQREEKHDEEVQLKVEERKPLFLDDLALGVESKEVLEAKKRQQIRANQKQDELKQYQKDGKILYGRLSGADYNVTKRKDKNTGKEIEVIDDVITTVVFDGEEIFIRSKNYFHPTTVIAKDFDEVDSQKQFEYMKNLLQRRIGSIVPFVLTYVSNDLIVGDRVTALRKLQDYYFYHQENKNGPSVAEGDMINARVIEVKPFNVTVECCGVETRIDQFYLTNQKIDNCHDYVTVGDVIPARIVTLHLNENEKDSNGAYLKISGLLTADKDKLDKIKIGGNYLGVIKSYNKEKGIFTVSLNNGVNVSVHKQKEGVNSMLMLNDIVSVLITDKAETHVIGFVLKRL